MKEFTFQKLNETPKSPDNGVNEFLFTALTVGLLGHLAVNVALSGANRTAKKLAELKKTLNDMGIGGGAKKDEKEIEKIKAQIKSEKEKIDKESEQDYQKSTGFLATMASKMGGLSKSEQAKMQEQLDLARKVIAGKASPEEIERARKDAEEATKKADPETLKSCNDAFAKLTPEQREEFCKANGMALTQKEQNAQITGGEGNGEGEPKPGEGEPKPGEGEPKPGEGEPKPGEGEPKPQKKDGDAEVIPHLDADGDPDGQYVVRKEKDADGNEKYALRDADGKEKEINKEDFETAKSEYDSYEDIEDEDDEIKDAKDEIEDEDEQGNKTKIQNPAKIWHRKKKKNGTGSTKSYYNKNGDSISADEYKEKMDAFKKAHAKSKQPKPQPNESLVNWITPIKEAVDANETARKEIIIQRLAFIKYAINNTDEDSKGLQDMYNALYNVAFNKDGSFKTNYQILQYLKETMRNNMGNIPGLPSAESIENIDRKTDALLELNPDALNKYMKEVDKQISSSPDSSKKNSDIANPDKVLTDDELRKKILEISDVEGLTNVIGLEVSQSTADVDKEKHQKLDKEKQEKLGNPTSDKDQTKPKDQTNPKDIAKDSEEIDKMLKESNNKMKKQNGSFSFINESWKPIQKPNTKNSFSITKLSK